MLAGDSHQQRQRPDPKQRPDVEPDREAEHETHLPRRQAIASQLRRRQHRPGRRSPRKDVPEAEQQQIRSHRTPQRDLRRRQPTQMQRQQQIANEQRKESGEHPSRTHLLQRGRQLTDPARGAQDDQQRADAHPRPKQESDDPLQPSRSYRMLRQERQRRVRRQKACIGTTLRRSVGRREFRSAAFAEQHRPDRPAGASRTGFGQQVAVSLG